MAFGGLFGCLVAWWLGGLVAWWLGGLVAWWLVCFVFFLFGCLVDFCNNLKQVTVSCKICFDA